MKKLSTEQVLILEKVGKKYDCEFYLPPFGSRNNPFFLMDEIQKDAVKFQKFMVEVKNVGVKHSFRTLRRKQYMEITGSE